MTHARTHTRRKHDDEHEAKHLYATTATSFSKHFHSPLVVASTLLLFTLSCHLCIQERDERVETTRIHRKNAPNRPATFSGAWHELPTKHVNKSVNHLFNNGNNVLKHTQN